MKIVVLGQQPLITSAVAIRNDQDNTLKVLINTSERYMHHHVSSNGSGRFLASLPPDTPTPTTLHVAVHDTIDYDDSRTDITAEVVFIAESVDEEHLLSGNRYISQEDEQLVVFIQPFDPALVAADTNIAHWPV